MSTSVRKDYHRLWIQTRVEEVEVSTHKEKKPELLKVCYLKHTGS